MYCAVSGCPGVGWQSGRDVGVGSAPGGVVTLRLHRHVLPLRALLQEDAASVLGRLGRGQLALVDARGFDVVSWHW